jgi:hypothetical protein
MITFYYSPFKSLNIAILNLYIYNGKDFISKPFLIIKVINLFPS